MNRRVYRIKAGDIDRLKISEETTCPLKENDVLIEVKAIGLNFADVFAILGLYSATPKGAFIPGLELCGIIVDIGVSVKDYKIGDAVMGATRFGAYASHVTLDESYIQALPQGWNYQQGASYMVQVLTAQYGLLNLGALSSEKNVLIHSAAGGVGIWANRICKYYGAFTMGTVGHQDKVELLNREGYDRSVVRNPKTFKEDLRAMLDGKSLDIIMECIGGKIMKIGFEELGQMGRHVIYGSAQYGSTGSRPNYFKLIPKYLTRPKIDPQNMIKHNKAVMAFNLIYLFENKTLMKSMLKDLEVMNLGKPIVGHVFDFEELPNAIKLFQAGKTTGKVVVEIT